MGHDKERSHIGKLFPGALTSVRTVLIDTLAAAVGQEHADAITNALDAYLEVEPADRLPAFLWLPPDPNVELDKLRKERDEAVARAEEAELKLRCTSTTHDKIAGTDTRCVLAVGHTGRHEDGVPKKKSR